MNFEQFRALVINYLYGAELSQYEESLVAYYFNVQIPAMTTAMQLAANRRKVVAL